MNAPANVHGGPVRFGVLSQVIDSRGGLFQCLGRIAPQRPGRLARTPLLSLCYGGPRPPLGVSFATNTNKAGAHRLGRGRVGGAFLSFFRRGSNPRPSTFDRGFSSYCLKSHPGVGAGSCPGYFPFAIAAALVGPGPGSNPGAALLQWRT